MTDSLLELMREDRAKENEEAKNGLEGWVIDTRARINDEEELERVSTETWREKFKETLEEAEDWLYEGGEGGGANANKTQFTAKKGELMDQFRAVGYRADELKKRPGVVEEARTFLAETTELLELWTTTKPWLPESGKAGLLDSIKTFNVTLEKWVAEQEETSLLNDPVFGTYEVTAKIKPMRERLERLKKQKEPKKKAEASKKAAADNATAEAANTTAEAEVEADTQQVDTG